MKRVFLSSLVVLLCWGEVSFTPTLQAQEQDPVAQFVELINQARSRESLSPYGWSNELAAAAQRHANDLAANQLASHIGTDGSDASQRIAEAGYAAWGGTMVGENYWAGTTTPRQAFDWFMESQPHRENILNPRYREIGVGVATDIDGRSYYVLNFGARPNVLPIFINDGAATTESPQVAILLTNEEAYPLGEGSNRMGRAIEVRISNEPDLDDQPWRQWEPLVDWALPDQPAEYTIYVQFRDGAGRTAVSTGRITLVPGPDMPTPLPPTPTLTPVPPTATSAPTDTPIPSPIPTEELPPSPTAAPPAPPSPIPVATPAVTHAVEPTPFLTWTPLPPAIVASAPSEGEPLLGFLCGLELLAVLLGVFLALRRRDSV
jgi:hypothetical protein